MNELETRIAELNRKAKTINATRQQNIGRRETLLKQQAEAIDAYNKKYGKSITAETVMQEYENVSRKKEEEVEHIERIISAIENGNLDEANTLAGVKPDVVKEAGVDQAKIDSVAENAHEESFVNNNDTIKETKAEVDDNMSAHSETKGTPFIPSPISNPMNEQTGSISGMPLGGSIFERDFSKPEEDDDDEDMGKPAPPPKIGSLF